MRHLLNTTFELRRRTSVIIAAQPASSVLSILRDPDQPASLLLKLTGASQGTGTVFLWGSDPDGSYQREEIIFTENGIKQSELRYSSIAGATTSGFDDELTVGTIEANAVTPSGEPVYDLATIAQNIPGRFNDLRGELEYGVQGEFPNATKKLFAQFESASFLSGDYVGSDADGWYKVVLPKKFAGHVDQHHWELLLEEFHF